MQFVIVNSLVDLKKSLNVIFPVNSFFWKCPEGPEGVVLRTADILPVVS